MISSILISAIPDLETYWRETEYAPPADPFIMVEPDDLTEDTEAAIARLVYAPREERFCIQGGDSKWETR